MSKSVYFKSQAQAKLIKGIKTLADAVKLTLGPKGRNVILEQSNEPLITNDGVTIAKNITFEDNAENLGANVIKSACIKTNNEAGDGTTSATILAEAIITNGLKYINTGANPIFMRNGIKKTVDFSINQLKQHTIPIKDCNAISQVAYISSGSEKIGKLIASAYEKVGLIGSIMLENSINPNTTLEIVEGVRINNGYISPYMCDEGKHQIELENPYILITDKVINQPNDILPIMEQVAKAGGSLVIIADDVEGDALNTIVINDVRKTFKCVCIKAPFYANRKVDTLADLSLIVGANFISNNLYKNLQDVSIEDLGSCNKIVIGKDNTTIINSAIELDKIKQRIDELKQSKINATDYEKECIETRINMLCGKVAVIKVGANSEIELNENKLRIEDAINATKSAIEEGIIVGGGTAFVKIIPQLIEFSKTLIEDEKLGAEVVIKSLECITRQIAKNAGLDDGAVLQTVKNNTDFNFGFNAQNNQFCNLLEAGVIDPFKVTRTTLATASSVASTLLTTDCVVVNNKK